MKNYFDLKGQVALVTGCSSGLGVQMAKALANQGCNIVAVKRRNLQFFSLSIISNKGSAYFDTEAVNITISYIFPMFLRNSDASIS